MNTAAGGLKDLHQIHIQLREVQEKLKRGPRQIKARQQIVQKKLDEIAALKEQLKQLKLASDQKSLQLKTSEGKIAELKIKLNQAQSNREFDIIKGQIEADTMAKSVLEDEILESLEKVDALKAKIAEAEQEHAAAVEQEKRIAAEVAAAEPGLKAEEAQLSEALAAAEKGLPSAIMDKYRRLVSAHGADCMARVEERACTACYTRISPNKSVELNVGKIIFCHSCGRLLYQVEAESH